MLLHYIRSFFFNIFISETSKILSQRYVSYFFIEEVYLCACSWHNNMVLGVWFHVYSWENTMVVKEEHLISSITLQHIFWDTFLLNLKFTVSLDWLVPIWLTVSASNTWFTGRYSHARLSCGYCLFEVGLSGLYTKCFYKAKHPSDWNLYFTCDKTESILVVDNRCTIGLYFCTSYNCCCEIYLVTLTKNEEPILLFSAILHITVNCFLINFTTVFDYLVNLWQNCLFKIFFKNSL